MSVRVSLQNRWPQLADEVLVAGLTPPPTFRDVSFANYLPDSGHPSQAEALTAVQDFADQVTTVPKRRKRRAGQIARGIYLDGGFGVGKTHLLAALFWAAEVPRAYATFVELTHLVGVLGFARAQAEMGELRLLCIDEFELDDPGDTVLISSLLTSLAEQGVWLAATSNTLPDRLGEGRFAADDFIREIQRLGERFTVVRIDGPDYRHREDEAPPEPIANEEAAELAAKFAAEQNVSVDEFDGLLAHLRSVHPAHYGGLVADVDNVFLLDVCQVSDQNDALRLVSLVDRLYDSGCTLVSTGLALDQVFAPDMLQGGYRKKYYRALSRLGAMALAGSRC